MNVKMSRNDPCPCGSGKKYKKCCGQHKFEPPATTANAVRPADMRQLLTLINARRYRELESKARELSVQHPDSGAVWKALGFALGMQGKPALQVLARAAALLPNDQVGFASFKFKVAFGPQEQLQMPAAEHTQHLNAKEVAAIMGKGGVESSADMPALPVQINPLPDVYPEDRPAR